jgi:uncharacterized membrane protein
VVLLPPERIKALRFLIGLLAYLAGYFAVYFVPGFLLMRALRIDLVNGVSNSITAFTLSLTWVALAWIATNTIYFFSSLPFPNCPDDIKTSGKRSGLLEGS